LTSSQFKKKDFERIDSFLKRRFFLQNELKAGCFNINNKVIVCIFVLFFKKKKFYLAFCLNV